MDVLRTVERLFEQHAPETLMALFGAVTSILLFFLIGSLLRYGFGWLMRTSTQEADQDQATSALMELLVGALVSEAGHLRQTLDGILQELLRCGEQNARVLTMLLNNTEKIPSEVLQLLKPELEQLHQELAQTEARLVLKMAGSVDERVGEKPSEN